MAECPNINRDITTSDFNVLVDHDGYVFYRHDDGFGKVTNVQFCKLIGRKRDPFECLNESEWKAWPYYRNNEEAAKRRNA
jgi:hypothetical protein